MAKKLSTKIKILNALNKKPEQMLTPKAIAVRTRSNPNTVRRCLQELANALAVETGGNGTYGAFTSS